MEKSIECFDKLEHLYNGIQEEDAKIAEISKIHARLMSAGSFNKDALSLSSFFHVYFTIQLH